MNTILINGVVRPYKKTNRALRRLEAKGIDLTGSKNQVNLMIHLAYEMVKEGHLVSKDLEKGKWTMTVEQFEAYDAEEDFIQEITEKGLADEKKPLSSYPENGATVVSQNLTDERILETIPKAPPKVM
tara:strand:+ start:208 stop:591 length:384 start_codon:yes stop_codon:yes gene_type:complete